jgi:hypothetical protein
VLAIAAVPTGTVAAAVAVNSASKAPGGGRGDAAAQSCRGRASARNGAVI